MVDDCHAGLPTPRSTLRAGYLDVLVWCKACRQQAPADLQRLVDSSRGDTPLIHLRYRCSKCGSRLTDWVVTVTVWRAPCMDRADQPAASVTA